MRKLQLMGRRRFLEALSGLGLSGTTLKYISKENISEITEDPQEEIPYVAFLQHQDPDGQPPEGPATRNPIWDTIAKPLWKKVETAHKAAQRVNRMLNRQFSSGGVYAGVTSGRDQYDKKIKVNYIHQTQQGEMESPTTPIEEVRDRLPSKVEGRISRNNREFTFTFPIIVEEEIVSVDQSSGGLGTSHSCDGGVFDDDYDLSIPGGVESTGGTVGTPAVRNGSGEPVMVHCGHTADDNFHLRQPRNVDSSDFKRGEYENGGWDDYGFYYTFDGIDLVWKLGNKYGGTKDPKISGIMTWEHTKNKEGDTSFELFKQGNYTGVQDGHITETSIWSGTKLVKYSTPTWRGDSGGPVVHHLQDPNYDVNQYYVCAIHAYRPGDPDTCPGSAGRGNAMEYIENKLDITV